MPASIPLSPATPEGRAGIGQAMPWGWALPSHAPTLSQPRAMH